MSVTINGTNGITFNDNTTQATSPFAGGLGFRNRIINGDMRIDQRNNGASVTPVNTNYTLDRWQVYASQASKFTVQQNAGSVTPPAGFTNYLGMVSSSAYSVLAGDYFGIRQAIEGFNVADFGWGTANAQAATLSFRVYSSLTGTFGGAFGNGAGTRSYPFTYSVPAANTWTTVTVTVPGDTAGTWPTTNGIGLYVYLPIGVGSTYLGTAGAWSGSLYFSATGATNVVGTNGATFYITGVQLEKGSTATSFDYRPYGTELALCQRYFETFAASENIAGIYALGWASSGTNTRHCIPYQVQKRSSPTVTFSAASTFNMQLVSNVAVSSFVTYVAGTKAAWIGVNYGSTVITAGQACALVDSQTSGGSSFIQFSSEL